MSRIVLAYAYFCDDNDLKRTDATPEEHIQNLDKMATALLAYRLEQLRVIESRCPHCRGTGKR